MLNYQARLLYNTMYCTCSHLRTLQKCTCGQSWPRVCVCVCVCICVHAHVCVCVCMCVCVLACLHVHVTLCICAPSLLYSCLYANKHIIMLCCMVVFRFLPELQLHVLSTEEGSKEGEDQLEQNHRIKFKLHTHCVCPSAPINVFFSLSSRHLFLPPQCCSMTYDPVTEKVMHMHTSTPDHGQSRPVPITPRWRSHTYLA